MSQVSSCIQVVVIPNQFLYILLNFKFINSFYSHQGKDFFLKNHFLKDFHLAKFKSQNSVILIIQRKVAIKIMEKVHHIFAEKSSKHFNNRKGIPNITRSHVFLQIATRSCLQIESLSFGTASVK